MPTAAQIVREIVEARWHRRFDEVPSLESAPVLLLWCILTIAVSVVTPFQKAVAQQAMMTLGSCGWGVV